MAGSSRSEGFLASPASFLKEDTGREQVSCSPTARLLLVVGSPAELSRVNVAQLHSEVSRACDTAAATPATAAKAKKRPREAVTHTPAQHHKWCLALRELRSGLAEAHECTEPCACEEFRTPSAFRKRDSEEQDGLLPWRLHHDLVPFANYSVTAPAWPEAQSIIYMDGSEDGTAACKTGSGVYRAEPPLQLSVDPCGLGATNTITRAELVAIYGSLRHAGPADCVMAADSQASMYMIRNQRSW